MGPALSRLNAPCASNREPQLLWILPGGHHDPNTTGRATRSAVAAAQQSPAPGSLRLAVTGCVTGTVLQSLLLHMPVIVLSVFTVLPMTRVSMSAGREAHAQWYRDVHWHTALAVWHDGRSHWRSAGGTTHWHGMWVEGLPLAEWPAATRARGVHGLRLRRPRRP
jgi:hypothetical protein